MDIFAGEEGTSDYHTTGGRKVYAPMAVIIRQCMQASWSDYRSVHFLPAYLSIHVPNNDFHVPSRAAIVDLLQLRVERFLLVVGSSFMWAVHVDDAVVEEPALYPQLAHPCVDRLPPHHALAHLTQYTMKPVPSSLVVPVNFVILKIGNNL